uniref:GGDEF domain-containing protein n=1 Tax=candidate division WOR-3 bacterium TaxID=2052148 RepID=A0A7V4E4M6_UNCW3
MDLFNLSFKDPGVERKFCEEYARKSLPIVRFALLFGIFLYSIFALLDAVIVGILKTVIWMIRFGFVVPIAFTLFLLTFLKPFHKHLQTISSLAALIGGFGILAMLAIIKPPSMYLYSQGLTLVLFFNFALLRLRFSYASINGLLLLIGFQIVSLKINPLPKAVFINNNFFLVSTYAGGLFVSYVMEKLERENFLNTLVLKKFAETDGLTGIMNRNSLLSTLRIESQRVGKKGESLVFCMIDLDNFKEINDYFGHLKGDEHLKNFGQILSKKFRTTDYVGRVGGDEFGVILVGLSDIERVIDAFGDVRKEYFRSQADSATKSSFSVGCVFFNSFEAPQDEFFFYSLADLALSKAKKKKDSICIVDQRNNCLYLGEIKT